MRGMIKRYDHTVTIYFHCYEYPRLVKKTVWSLLQNSLRSDESCSPMSQIASHKEAGCEDTKIDLKRLVAIPRYTQILTGLQTQARKA
jgi:hypothetical protein